MANDLNTEMGSRLATLVREGQELIAELTDQDDDAWVDDSEVIVYQKWLASVGNAFLLTGGTDCSYIAQFREIVNSQRNPAGLMVYVVRKVFGLLLSALEESTEGTLKAVESIVTPAVYDDLLDEAEQLREAGRLMESSVVASTVFGLTVKKVAIKNELRPHGKTTVELLDALAKAGVFNQRQHRRLMDGHAVRETGGGEGWDAVAAADTAALIETTRKLVSGFL